MSARAETPLASYVVECPRRRTAAWGVRPARPAAGRPARGTALRARDATFNYVSLDLPPFGYSVLDSAVSYGRAAQAARIGAFIDTLALEQVILVAHSYGAGPAAGLVLRGVGHIPMIEDHTHFDEALFAALRD